MSIFRTKFLYFFIVLLYMHIIPSYAMAQDCLAIEEQKTVLDDSKGFIYATSNRNLYLHVFDQGIHADKRPAVIFFFGGGFQIGDIRQFVPHAKVFAAAGYVVVLADYRVFCRDSSSVSDSISDARAAYAWTIANASRLGIDPTRVTVAGGSAGGNLAAMVALDPHNIVRPKSLIMFNPVVDLSEKKTRHKLRLSKYESQLFSPISANLDNLPPTIILHAQGDKIASITSVRKFCARALSKNRTCTLVEYPGLDHGFFNSQNFSSKFGQSLFNDAAGNALNFTKRMDEIN